MWPGVGEGEQLGDTARGASQGLDVFHSLIWVTVTHQALYIHLCTFQFGSHISIFKII